MKSTKDAKLDKARYISHLEIGKFNWFMRNLYCYMYSTFWYVKIFRLLQASESKMGKRFFGMILRFSGTLTGIQIHPKARVGGGLLLPHFGTIVINGRAVIGKNCTIFHNTTIGAKGVSDDINVPIISDGVYIGAGAVLLGGINIGRNAVIGANSVVTKDVPDKAVVAGNPARIIKRL